MQLVHAVNEGWLRGGRYLTGSITTQKTRLSFLGGGEGFGGTKGRDI